MLRRSLLALLPVLWNGANSRADDKLRPLSPTGMWRIETQPPVGALKLCHGFLPNGTRVRLQVEGPTRRAIEEDIKNQLGVTITLLPPLAPSLCSLDIGRASPDAKPLCVDGKFAVDANLPFELDDAAFDFRRLTAKDISSRTMEFFTDRGAELGSPFALLWRWQRAGDWDLWLKSPDQMVSECIVKLPGKNNIDSFPMIWNREPAN